MSASDMKPKDVRLARLERNFRHLAERASAASLAEGERSRRAVARARATTAAAAARETGSPVLKRGRAAVVAWDLAHNPVGRAHVIYRLLEQDWDVDLIGPIWSRYGDSVWQPLADGMLNIRSFRCSTLADFVPKAEALAATCVYDLVVACKARLPSIYLGALIKQSSGCPMLLDVDDAELSFFDELPSLTFDEANATPGGALNEPYEEIGTRYAESLIPSADALIVSNVALRARFGGHVIRHARDETEFVNSPERRLAARERLGIAEDEFALMFIGTPRAHKGVLDVAAALDEIGDDTISLHIIGDFDDPSLRRQLANHGRARVVLHPGCAFDELPDLLAGADLVPLLQDTTHAVSQFQIPAKVSDALSLGVPVLATPTPPLADLIAAGAIRATDPGGLADAIRLLRERATAGEGDSRRARQDFVNELGFDVNRARLAHAVEEAIRRNAEAPGVLDETLTRTIEMMRERYVATCRQQSSPAIISTRSRNYDIAFFWKQNDSGLYGRRSDMLTRYLAASGRVSRLLHLDAPLSLEKLENSSASDTVEKPEIGADQAALIRRNVIDRGLGVFDNEIIRARTFVGSDESRRGRLLGRVVYRRESYVRYVNEQLEEAGMRADRTLAWFCPVIWDARELIDKVGFGSIAVDLIDDQRGWDAKPAYLAKLEANYRDTLGAADIVFANCASLADAMKDFAPAIHVVPNGAERFADLVVGDVPATLADIPGPVAGYVGNLRDRIDWMLMHRVVTEMTDVSFVFFGPHGDNANAQSLAKHPNVHVLGIVPYAELPDHLRSFDVGLVPHLSNRLTERMNPLKVYNYFAAGLPIVSTEVNNLAELGGALRTAGDADGFARAIRDALAAPIDTTTPTWRSTMDSIAWDTRVETILEHMDRKLLPALSKSA